VEPPTFDHQRDLTVLEDIDAELNDIEHALRRLEDGSYGVCERCHQPIGEDRLEAVPAARLCVRHREPDSEISAEPDDEVSVERNRP
jgi:RNA polymerase-binding transcription factor DksA